MKRKPEKNYKLPKYAAGLAAMMLAGSMTGCTETAGDVQIDGGMDVPEETKYVELSGDVEVVEDTTEETAADTTEEVMLVGDVAPAETCTIETITEETDAETTAEPIATAGEVEFELGEPQTNPVPTQELMLSGDIAME